MSELPPVSRFRAERTARIAHLGPPDAPRALWVGLHGYRQLAPWFLRHLRGLDDGSRRLLAPEALNRFYVGDPDGRHGPETRVGATWMTREDRGADIDDYVRYLEAVLGTASRGAPGRPTVVLGFSQGAHTAARWMHRSAHDVRAVVLWGEGLPDDTAAADLAAAPRRWILVRGERDPSRSPGREARDAALFEEVGATWTVVDHGGGHRIDPAVLVEVARGLDA